MENVLHGQKGIYTTTFYEGRWVVLILPPNEPAQQLQTTFPDEPDAKYFMAKQRPELKHASNRAFMMAKQAQEMMGSGKFPDNP